MATMARGLDTTNTTKLETLYEKYKQLMFYTANRVLKDPYYAEDAVHKAFIKIMDNLHKIEDIDSSRTKSFLVIITRNVAITMYNSEKKQAVPLEILEATAPSTDKTPVDLMVTQENMAAITRCINRLDQKYADVLVLKFFHQYADVEIASMLDITHENVRVRLHRARAKLITYLEEEECLDGYQYTK